MMSRNQFISLLNHTIKGEEEFSDLQYDGMLSFMSAVRHLEAVGLTQRQLQLLIGTPFSRFQDEHCFMVRVLSLALKRGKARVSHWHDILREEALWAHMHGRDPWFTTESLPDLAAIDAELGLAAQLSLHSGGKEFLLPAGE
ncbi:MAG: hypothetical protein RBR77_16175 [Thauera sp.]|jgi:hypothetical protein|nr:hypothetical protein [Thauera sp.]